MKYLIIPKEIAGKFKQLKLTWWFGIDPVEIADGTFILNEDCYNLIKDFPVKTVTIATKELTVTDALKVYPLVDEKNIVFKISEEQISEDKVIGK